jgi:protein TonB
VTPPKPTDVLIKAKPPEKVVKTAPVETPPPPKHAQPTPDTTKATTGQVAAQLASSTVQVANGTATATIDDRAFGSRYAYYGNVVSRTVARNWYTAEADPRSSQGKKVTLVFDIARDGTPSNVRVEIRSGSASLDSSAVHALQRVDTFGPLPSGESLTVEFTFVYQQQ